jgi:hypothetical protein
MTYQERKNRLKLWRINCTCTLCTSPSRDIEISDRRRRRLRQIYEEIASNALDRTTLGDTVDEMMYLIETEGMWPTLVEYYRVIIKAYTILGYLDDAKKYADLVEEACGQYLAESSLEECVDSARTMLRP